MDIYITWYPPLPLSGGNPADLRYTVDGIEAWEDCPGVYMFCRWDNESLIPLYIGCAKNMYAQIRQHLDTTTLMRRIANGPRGEKILMLGEYIPQPGQSSEQAMAMVEKGLIEHAFMEGYALLNTAGTKTPTRAVTFSGFREAKKFSGGTMYVKAAS
jgi:hypothetical protein